MGEALITGGKRAEQLTFLALGGIMTVTGAVALMKPSYVPEQWRAWVFLILNLILLVILLSSGKNADENTNADPKNEVKMIDRQTSVTKYDSCDDELMGNECQSRLVEKQDCKDEQGYMNGCKDDDEDDELNERVEAFIVMFRQHLVADAKITKHRQL